MAKTKKTNINIDQYEITEQEYSDSKCNIVFSTNLEGLKMIMEMEDRNENDQKLLDCATFVLGDTRFVLEDIVEVFFAGTTTGARVKDKFYIFSK